jgi:hypothetical protein
MKTKVSQATEEEKTLLMNFATREIADETAKLNEIFVIPMEISDDEDIDTFLKLKEQWVSVNKIEIENNDMKHIIFNILSIYNVDVEGLDENHQSTGMMNAISYTNFTFKLVADKFEEISLNDFL